LTVLVSFLFVPLTPLVRSFVPVQETMLLFVPALAVCAILGWMAGGRLALAAFWTVLAAWILLHTGAPAHESYDRFARGWSFLVTGSFGLFCLLEAPRTFLARALLAVAVSLCIGTVTLLGTQGGARVARALADDIVVRHQPVVDEWDRNRASGETDATLRLFFPDNAVRAAVVEASDTELREVPSVALRVFPAMLALESLAALALAWSLYHRMSRTRIGAPLAPMRDFRFNDQLVWGLLAGVVALLLPTLSSFRDVGVNLLVFFGALYVARGAGVLVWFLTPGHTVAMLAVGVALVITGAFGAAFTFGLGLGDTWFDWRNRPRPTT